MLSSGKIRNMIKPYRSTLTWLAIAPVLAWLLLGAPVQALTFKPPGQAAPSRTTGGASRTGMLCNSSAEEGCASVTTLMPENNFGLTAASRPTFMVFVPKTSAQTALFSIETETGEQVHQFTVSLASESGVMAVALPADAPTLEVGKNYQWHLAMVLGDRLEPDSPTVSGWVRRVEATPGNSQPSLESASTLASAGIWYDSLATLAELRRLHPQDPTIAANWQELLTSVGLQEVAQHPLVD
jgi:Domain of Unknown Function (DUF928)